jgi:hypothetical protein
MGWLAWVAQGSGVAVGLGEGCALHAIVADGEGWCSGNAAGRKADGRGRGCVTMPTDQGLSHAIRNIGLMLHAAS